MLIKEIKSEIIGAQKKGDYLKEYDLARAALESYPHDEFLQCCLVLALSRSNAKQRALDSFYSFKLHLSSSEYVRSLEPRIMKGLAFQSLDQDQPFLNYDREKFHTAAANYYQAFLKTGGHYSAINAATLYLFSGEREKAVDLATSAFELAQKDHGPKYFPMVTQAEACLILDRREEARKYIAEASVNNEKNLFIRSRNHRQLKLICKFLGIDIEIIAPLLPETVINYCGQVFNQRRPLTEKNEHEISRHLDEVILINHCAIAYGSLAAGADILIAEAILRHGGELNVWLPFGKESFCDELVRPSGDNWVERYENCIENANTVSYATESDFLGESSLFNFCADVVMGMAIMRANSLRTKVMQVAVWDQVESTQRSGTYTNVAKWKALGHHSVIIPAPARLTDSMVRQIRKDDNDFRRESHAILFGDIRGYSKLGDNGILWYFNVLQPKLAAVIEEYRSEIQHLDTWGDALFLVTEKASIAAKIATALNAAISRVDQSSLNLDEPLLMRIGLHFGPVYKLYDHLKKSITYSSNDVNKTARIEPVTPPGEIFGTEPFVAILELEGEGWASFDYAGTITIAKKYGELRMFHVRPKHDTQSC